ncbi:MAG: hypothetical protein JRF61_04705 [Deltaproteobacteria bacterium]|jgi:N-methylhydantoinase B|nr:hypothetical protein [Deltaproteobacteria bacterium]
MSYEVNDRLAARRCPLPTNASIDAVSAAIIRDAFETICDEVAKHLRRGLLRDDQPSCVDGGDRAA